MLYIPIIKKEETCKICVEKILYVEQDLRKIIIYAENEHFWCYGKIDGLSKYLDEKFFRCHKSCIINMDKVIKMKEQTIFFEDGSTLYMGRGKFQRAKQNFAQYIGEIPS